MWFLKQLAIAAAGAAPARELAGEDDPSPRPPRPVSGASEAALQRARALASDRAAGLWTRPLVYPGVLVLPPFDRT